MSMIERNHTLFERVLKFKKEDKAYTRKTLKSQFKQNSLMNDIRKKLNMKKEDFKSLSDMNLNDKNIYDHKRKTDDLFRNSINVE